MFHYGVLLEEGKNKNLVEDLLDNKDLITKDSSLQKTFFSNSKNLEIANQLILEPNLDSDRDILKNQRNQSNKTVTNNSLPRDSVFLKCNCANCCRGFLPQDLESQSFLSNTQKATIPLADSLPQNIINSLLTGYQWNSKTITYSFYEDDVFNGSYYGSETGVREVSEGIKSNVREILELVETFVDLDFVEVTETDNNYGKLRYMLSNNPGYAYAYIPYGSDPKTGDVHLKYSYDHRSNLNGFQNDPGKHGYTTLIHETFHALGLDHPHERTVLDPLKNNSSNTVMTYDSKGNSPGTAMPYDIAALQHLYGAAANNVGDDVYVFGKKTDAFTLNGQSPLTTNHQLKQTIWDSNGTDTLDFSNLEIKNGGYLFDLNEGGWLVANAHDITNDEGERYYNYGTSLAYDVTIENAIASRSDDTIIANDAANTFSGYQMGSSSGNDTLINTNGLDTLDLSSYSPSDVTQTKTGNDLKIDLGVDGSVTVKDYYGNAETNRLDILLNVDPGVSSIAIAEIGKITNFNQNQRTIQLQNDYVNPVVFAQPLSFKGQDPSIIRITDIDATKDTVSFYLQEAEYKDGWHTKESFSYMVVEAGTWRLENGSLLEVGTVNSSKVTTSGWENISFSHNFGVKPVVLSQVQTNNDREFVRTRQKSANANGFSVTMEEEEALSNSGHGEETIGWLAIESGAGDWDNLSYKAGNTGNVVTHNWRQLNFSDFATTPNLLGSIATYYGRDSSGLRYQDISGTNNVKIKIEEDRSKDDEIIHTTEDVNFLAIEGNGILTAQADNFLANSILGDNAIADIFPTNTDGL